MKSSKSSRRRRVRKPSTALQGFTTFKPLFPAQFRGNHAYLTALLLSPAVGSVATNVFRLNSLYDPDLSGVGTSATGYAAAAALYNRYRVLRARAEISWTNLSTTIPATAFVVTNPVTTVGTSWTQIAGQRHVWYKSLSVATGNSTAKHVVTVPLHEVYGVPYSQLRDEDDFAAVTGTNPNNGIYLHVGVFNDGGAAGSVNIHVRIIYDVAWSIPLEMT